VTIKNFNNNQGVQNERSGLANVSMAEITEAVKALEQDEGLVIFTEATASVTIKRKAN
jgi:hypothetical protein